MNGGGSPSPDEGQYRLRPLEKWMRENEEECRRLAGKRVAFHTSRIEVVAEGETLNEVVRALAPEQRRDPAIIFTRVPPDPVNDEPNLGVQQVRDPAGWQAAAPPVATGTTQDSIDLGIELEVRFDQWRSSGSAGTSPLAAMSSENLQAELAHRADHGMAVP